MTSLDSGTPSLHFFLETICINWSRSLFLPNFFFFLCRPISLSTMFTKFQSLSSSFIHPQIVPSGTPHTRDKLAFVFPLFTRSIIFNFSATEYDFRFCDILTRMYDSDWNCISTFPCYENWSQAERLSTLVQYKTPLFLCTVILPGMQRSVIGLIASIIMQNPCLRNIFNSIFEIKKITIFLTGDILLPALNPNPRYFGLLLYLTTLCTAFQLTDLFFTTFFRHFQEFFNDN